MDLFNVTTGWNYTWISHYYPHSSKWTMVPYAITFLLSVPGNSAVIWVTGFKMEKKVHTMSFLYLAVADLTYCLTLPFWMVNVAMRGTWIRGDIPFLLLLSSIIFNGSVRVFMLTLISILRCLAITRPVWFHQHMRLRWVHAAFFGVCGFSILMCIIALLYIKAAEHFGYRTWDMMKVIWAVFIFFLPVVIMTACCVLTGRRLHRDKFAKSRKPVRLIMTVVAAFIASWLPFHSCSFAVFFFHFWDLTWNDVAIALACFNSALNPFLYVFTGRNFRQVFRRSLVSALRLAFYEEDEERPSKPNNFPVTSAHATLPRNSNRTAWPQESVVDFLK